MNYTRTSWDIQHLSNDEIIELIQDGYDRNYEWWVDTLDCSVSWARQRCEMSYEEVMKKFCKGCHFTFITGEELRHSVEDECLYTQRYIEICFSTMTTCRPEYFLWIEVDADECLNFFIKKYKLKEWRI
jgi:hypothetical protein